MNGPRRLGDYEIVRELGRGGMGVVYEARHQALGRRVALKVMTGGSRWEPDLLERFRREALIAATLAHPGICTIYDAGTAEGIPFLAMQFVEGETLARRIAGRRRATESQSSALSEAQDRSLVEAPSIEEGATEVVVPRVSARDDSTATAAVGRGTAAGAPEIEALIGAFEMAARALAAAHAEGVLHRDVKPSNIMITPSGRPVLLDFGLARRLEGEDHSLTATGALVGTPAYFAPEVLAGRPGGFAADVYALGVSLYEALAGRRPFEGATREALYDAVLRSAPPSLRSLNPRVSRDLQTVVATAIERDPARRYADARALADDLERVRRGEPILARRPTPFGVAWRWAKRRPAVAALVLLGFLTVATAAVALGYFFAVRDDVLAARREADRADYEKLLAEGFLDVSFGDPQAATEIFRRAVAMDATPEALAGLCLALHETDRPHEIVDLLLAHESAVERAPALRVILAAALEGSGQKERAAAISAEGQEPKDGVDSFVRGLTTLAAAVRGDRGAALRAWNDFTDATTASERARQIHHILRVRAAGASHDQALLERSERPLIAKWPDSALTWFAVGLGREEAEDAVGARAAYEKVTALAPRHVEGWCRLADTRRKCGDQAGARAALDRAKALDPGDKMTILMEAILVDASGAPGAEALYEKVLEIEPGMVTARMALARLARDRGDAARARSEAEKARAADPRHPAPIYMLGILKIESGETDGAIDLFREAIRCAPTEAVYHHGLATALGILDDAAGAVVAAREAYRLSPGEADYAYTLGSFLFEVGPFEEAVGALRKCVELDPKRAEALGLLGRALMHLEKHEEAIDCFDRSLRLGTLKPELKKDVEAWRELSEKALDG